jgi:deoxyribodipyrimidine photo-lyase
MTTPSVLWFRRDLRLADNPALLAAVAEGGGRVVPLFVLDERLLRPAGPNRIAFLFRALRALDASMGGGRLVVRAGDPVDVVPALAREVGAPHVHVTADFGPYGRRRDAGLAGLLVRSGSPYAVEPGSARKTDGTSFRVFTPFFRMWRTLGWDRPEPAPDDVDWVGAVSEGVPEDPPVTATLPEAGEAAGHERLEAFLAKLDRYADERDTPGIDATSRLSVDLKYGTLHPRQVLDRLGRSAGASRFRTELAWREFYADVLWHRPETAREVLQSVLRHLEVDEGPEADERFAAWATGRTGYPIVDAGMRQLVAEGWMHNRVRMITASFLVKDLHLDWRRGARFFLRHLVDGDLASNQHGWQWVAGTGTDPSPFHRIFNPTRQAERFDPDGDYVRRYVPELGTAAYPAPIVDHDTERKDALARYAAAKAAAGS